VCRDLVGVAAAAVVVASTVQLNDVVFFRHFHFISFR
jgi:hypothetical protein